ncbi:methyltransferase domain-containing protein [Mitsuaria sp. GD03876]|uniref:methyltransferase domain-containing protein n=1 Tax=Mitsuaria sp. GD03876 TaxID=2975399 RepID=UPI00244D0AD5|nr:methyltransferase domain-containing protein [Mitsuaria sp. GD03876]MDH0864989.1 methyltransferase domain-containing protein [Mitsuaria sp. GD03876]
MDTHDQRPALQALDALYGRRAAIYDYELMPVAPLRREAIAALGLEPGQTVLDIGAGTGLSLPDLCRAVGRGGRVVAVEPCESMMRQARQRARVDALAAPVDFLPATAEEAPYASVLGDRRADAALFFFTHDVLQSVSGIERALAVLKPGARIVAAGLAWAPPWLPMSNLFVLGAAAHSVIRMDGLDCPWRHLEARMKHAEVERRWLASAYVLTGQV